MSVGTGVVEGEAAVAGYGVLDDGEHGEVFGRVVPAGGVDVKALADGGGLFAQADGEGRHELAEGSFGGGAHGWVGEGARLGHEEGAELGLVEPGNVGTPVALELPAALGSSERRDGDVGGAEGLHIAMDGALGDLQAVRELAAGDAALGLEKQQRGEEAVGLHGSVIFPFLRTFLFSRRIYDSRCHIWNFMLRSIAGAGFPSKGELAMELKDFFLEQLEQEAAASRKVVERVPEGRNDWKPHERSMPLGHLAALVATMPGWLILMVERDELNLDDPESEKFRTKPMGSREELLKALDASVSGAKKVLEATTEDHLMKPWRFSAGGHLISDKPRYVMLSESLFSHLAHHRGQLTVYLRLNEASVPAIYGPSADEQF